MAGREDSRYDTLISSIIKNSIEISSDSPKYNDFVDYSASIFNLIYKGDFRHSYSNISLTLNQIYEENEEKNEDIFSNIKSTFEKIEKNLCDESDVRNKFFKLIDHIKLECQRIENSQKTIDDLKKSNDALKTARKKYDESLEKIKEIQEETSNLNNQLVSILGIFTGIIITFFGGVSIISGALGNMHQVNRFKLVFTISLVGMIVFNIVNSLILIIGKIINKNLQSTLCSQNLNCAECKICKNKNGKNKKIKMFIIKYPFVFFVNLIFILIMILIFVLWLFNFSQLSKMIK